MIMVDVVCDVLCFSWDWQVVDDETPNLRICARQLMALGVAAENIHTLADGESLFGLEPCACACA